MKVLAVSFGFLVSLAVGWLLTSVEESTGEVEPMISERSMRGARNEAATHARQVARKLGELETYDEQVRRVIALASSLSIDEIRDWHSQSYLDSLDADLENLFINITSERWLEVDPRGYLEWATVMKYPRTKLHIAKLAARDLEGAVSYVLEQQRSQVNRGMRDLIQNLAAIDLEKAFEAAHLHLASAASDSSTESNLVLATLSKLDLEAALALRATWSTELQERTISGVLEALFEDDFSNGLRFLEEEGKDWRSLSKAMGQRGHEDLRDLVMTRRKDLPEGWLEKMIEESPYVFRSKHVLEFLEQAPGNLVLSASALEKVLGTSAYVNFGKENRGRTMALVNGSEISLKTRMRFMKLQISRWPRGDSEGLRAWLGGLNDVALHEVADGALADFDERESSYSPGERKRPAVEFQEMASGKRGQYWSTGELWTPGDANEARKVYRTMNDSEKAILVNKLRDDDRFDQMPWQLSSEMLADALSQEDGRLERLGETITEFSNDWAKKAPGEAAVWVSGLPAGLERLEAAAKVAEIWQGYSPEETRVWVETLEPDEQAAVRKVLEKGR